MYLLIYLGFEFRQGLELAKQMLYYLSHIPRAQYVCLYAVGYKVHTIGHFFPRHRN
jgi:hypothetical protein